MKFLRDERAVSDVIGSILLVGITVAVVGGFAALILSQPGPPDTQHTQMRVFLEPGPGAWGDGDEILKIRHVSGEPIPVDGTQFLIRINGNLETFEGAGLGVPFSDGLMQLGETFTLTRAIDFSAQVDVDVVVSEASDSRLMSTSRIIAPAVAGNPCQSDVDPPFVVLWTQSPTDVSTTTTGTVTVQATVSDACAGVDDSATPTLFYRVNDGTNPAWVSAGAMILSGTSQWTLGVIDQGWGSLGGQTLEYYVSGLTDLNFNVGDSVVRQDIIDAIDPCIGETNPPTVGVLTQSPNDVNTQTTGAITVVVDVVDDCSGVDTAIAPTFQWRIDDGTNPGFTSTGAMTFVAGAQWTAQIPSQAWYLEIGNTLEYQILGMTDLNGNSGNSAISQDAIQPVVLYTYPVSHTATSGTMNNFANMQSATDGGAFATLNEASVAGGASTVYTLNADGILTINGFVNGANVFTSDDADAVDTSGNVGNIVASVQNAGFSGAISKVEIKAEVQSSGTNGHWQLRGCLSATLCTDWSTDLGAPLIDTVISYDITNRKPGGGAWSITDINNLRIEADAFKSGGGPNPDVYIDHMLAEVTSSSATHNMEIQLDWTGGPAGTLHQIELNYRVSGPDTFHVEVFDGLLWNTRGLNLDQSTFSPWTYTLTATEYNGGAPSIRIIDNDPSSAQATTLDIDYARVVTT